MNEAHRRLVREAEDNLKTVKDIYCERRADLRRAKAEGTDTLEDRLALLRASDLVRKFESRRDRVRAIIKTEDEE